jgi:CubicO group peptidase (beta-lactamase class C family)
MARLFRIHALSLVIIVGFSQAISSPTIAAPVVQCNGPCNGRPVTPPPCAIEELCIQQTVDAIVQPYLSQSRIPGAIVGVSIHGRRYFFPFGTATDAGAAFAPDTIVEIGSCTKVFTTTIYAAALNAGQIRPKASAQKYMPNDIQLQPNARAMTPNELAEFRSGMPDDPTNLMPGIQNQSITVYTTEDFLTWVSQWEPATPPPAPYKYSNSGIGLLGYLLAEATGQSWEKLLDSEILDPLGMTSTSLGPNPNQAMGHSVNGKDAPPWPVSAWYQAGGLRSTASDMLSFGEASLGHPEVDGHSVPASLTAAMQLAMKPVYHIPLYGGAQQGMAWITVPGDPSEGQHPVTLKNGGTDGFGTVIVISPFNDLAVFINDNQKGSPGPTDIGIEIAQRLQLVK